MAGPCPFFRTFMFASLGLGLFWVLPALPPRASGVKPLAPAAQRSVQVFLERFCRVAPGRRIAWSLDGVGAPPGFLLLRYDLSSSEASFDVSATLLLSRDLRWVFSGHVLGLPPGLVDPGGSKAPEALSRYLSERAGALVGVTWDSGFGPGSAHDARVRQETPLGPVTTGGALASDGGWFFFGTFYALAADPREERLRRLGLAGRAWEGPAGAPVTLVEFFDYQCPSCAELEPVIRAAFSRHARNVRLVPVDLPQWRSHDWAGAAAEADLCVAAIAPQAYGSYRQALFSRQEGITAQSLNGVLRSVLDGLNVPLSLLENCQSAGRPRERLLADLGAASTLGISATPVVLVNGALLEGKIEDVLEEEVARALAHPSGTPTG